MINDLKSRIRSLLTNLDSPREWSYTSGLVLEDDGSPHIQVDNKPLSETIPKEDLAEELKTALRQLELVTFQNEHQAHIYRTAITEIKMSMRQLVLNTAPLNQNPELKGTLKKSRLSTDTLFGPIPESMHHEILLSGDLRKLQIKPSVIYPAPSAPVSRSKPRGTSQPIRRGFSGRGRGGRRAVSLPQDDCSNSIVSTVLAHQKTPTEVGEDRKSKATQESCP